MKSHTEPRFWRFYDELPEDVRRAADEAYNLWQGDPYHPSLRFKRVDPEHPIYSVRIGGGYRALAWREHDTVTWFWIGNHDAYLRLLKRL